MKLEYSSHIQILKAEVHPPLVPHSTKHFEKDLFEFPPPSDFKIEYALTSTKISQCSMKYKQLLTYIACYTHAELTPNFVELCA